MRDFKDKVVLITGASSGIGKALALRVGRQGALVALVARSQQALAEVAAAIEQTGGRALVLPADVSEASQCQQAVEQAVKHYGKLDVVVCSAGLSMRNYLER